MAVVRKKQDDKYLEALRELITLGGGNRQCFDCGQKGPTYVNMTIGSFVCTRCSGVLRGLTPPHRVKSISMATFTQEEIDFLKTHGNDICSKTWLGLWDPKRVVHQDQRELMIDKYERKRYYLEPASPLKSLTNATNLKTTTASAGAFASISANKNCITQTNNNNNNSNSNNENNKNRNNNYNQNNNHSQLTPPSSQCNGLRRNTLTQKMTTTSTAAISRPQHNTLLQNSFNGIKETDAFGSGSVGAMSDTSSCASNGFSGEADFVADFGTANIFDATAAYSPEISPSNGYAKIQTLKPTRQSLNDGNQKNPAQISIPSLPNGHIKSENESGQFLCNANTENFADFEHAPIYNAAGLPMPGGFSNNQFMNSTRDYNKSNQNVSKSRSISSNDNNCNNKNYYNNNNNNINNNNNNSQSSPSEDRYAALKDLDEQLRESKAIAAQAISTVTSNVVDSGFGNPSNNNQINPFAAQLPQEHQQSQPANPFRNATHSAAQLFGQMTLIPALATTNGQKAQANASFFNYTSNGFNAAVVNGTNGCGFGFGTLQQQIALTGLGFTDNTFNNPFAATGALNANNPFL